MGGRNPRRRGAGAGVSFGRDQREAALTVQKRRMPLGGDGEGCAPRGSGPAGSPLQGSSRERGGPSEGSGLSPCLLSTPDWETEERPLEPRSPSKGQRGRQRTIRAACPAQTSGFPITDAFVLNVCLSARGWEAGEGGWAGRGSGNRDEGVGRGSWQGLRGQHREMSQAKPHRNTSWPQGGTARSSNGVQSSTTRQSKFIPQSLAVKKDVKWCRAVSAGEAL